MWQFRHIYQVNQSYFCKELVFHVQSFRSHLLSYYNGDEVKSEWRGTFSSGCRKIVWRTTTSYISVGAIGSLARISAAGCVDLQQQTIKTNESAIIVNSWEDEGNKMAQAVFGSIAAFGLDSEDITEWMERLEQWFEANAVTDAGQQRAI